MFVGWALPFNIYADVGDVPDTARVGLNPEICLLDIPCGGDSFLVRGHMTITVGGEPAFKGSIPVSKLNDDKWVPKDVVKIECSLNSLPVDDRKRMLACAAPAKTSDPGPSPSDAATKKASPKQV